MGETVDTASVRQEPIPKNLSFECRVCGCREYIPEVREVHMDPRDVIRNFAAGRLQFMTIGYSCSGCSVRFADPAKFSRPRSQTAEDQSAYARIAATKGKV